MIMFKPNWIQMKTRSYVFEDRNKNVIDQNY